MPWVADDASGPIGLEPFGLSLAEARDQLDERVLAGPQARRPDLDPDSA